MLYQSFVFIFVFLPLITVLWHFLWEKERQREAYLLLLLFSLVYYACFDMRLILLLFAAAAVSFLAGRGIMRFPEKRNPIAFFAVLLLLLLFFMTKLYLSSIMMTIGVSFFVLRFLTDILESRESGEAAEDPLLYLTYASFFPLLAEGPVMGYRALSPSLEKPERTAKNLTEGVLLLIIGLSKKVLLANALHPVADAGFSYAAYADFLTVLLTLTAYAFELYFDFSGYCDMGMGISKMLGLSIAKNFDAPYRAENVRTFWRHWHMTLVSFFTRFVYVPLGGSKKGFARQCGNILVVFILSALWHGFGFTYLLWGLLEGGKVIGSHALKRRGMELPAAVGRVITFLLFLLPLSFFRAETVSQALLLLKGLTHLRFPGFLFRVAASFTLPETYLPEKVYLALTGNGSAAAFQLMLLLLFLLLCAWLLRKGNAYEMPKRMLAKGERGMVLLTALIFVSALLSLNGVTSFLYFRY